MNHNFITIFFSCILFFSSFGIPQDAKTMEQSEEEREESKHHHQGISHPSPHLFFKEQLERFTSFIQQKNEKGSAIGSSLTLNNREEYPSDPKWLYFVCVPTSEECPHLQVGFNDFASLTKVAEAIPSSFDLITCGPRVFNILQEQHLRIFGSMLKEKGGFALSEREISPLIAVEESESLSYETEKDKTNSTLEKELMTFENYSKMEREILQQMEKYKQLVPFAK